MKMEIPAFAGITVLTDGFFLPRSSSPKFGENDGS
ncbi:MAG: hypothetical protein ACI905_002097, partial [Roseivirga sp.]